MCRVSAYSTRFTLLLWNLLKIPRTSEEVNGPEACPTDKSVDHDEFLGSIPRMEHFTGPKSRFPPLQFGASQSFIAAEISHTENWDTSESVTTPPFPTPKFPKMSLNQAARSCVTT